MELRPKHLQSFKSATSHCPNRDVLFPTVAQDMSDMFDAALSAITAAAPMRGPAFINRLIESVNEMEGGDRMLSLSCGPESQSPECAELMSIFRGRLQRQIEKRQILVRRLFLEDGRAIPTSATQCAS